MTVIEDFKSASLWMKLALCFLAVALVFACISFTTTGWGSATNIATSSAQFYGLWRICSDTGQITACQQLDGTSTDWYAATQAMVTFGFSGILISFFLLILFLFINSCKTNGQIGLAAGIVSIVTGILYLIGCIVFGTQWDKYYKDTPVTDYALEYGFALSIVALVLEITAGVFLIIETKRAVTKS
ncbi:unnamed protein product [Mytilus edulis]|uniref:Uncharacterized protein n=1 Tax=Mytilus edulis TaxID=6550 RepID=A0A8S3VBB2_MYTED|nr:unnamed protein product [Mytilus edulis]